MARKKGSLPVPDQVVSRDATVSDGDSSSRGAAEDLRVDSRSTAPGPALPPPIGSESPARPVHDRGRLNEDEGLAPARPEAMEPYPEESEAILEPQVAGSPTEDHPLLAKRDVLDRRIPSTPQHRHEAPHRDT